jgi:DNA repair exonuclease SbcCD ATPase subunit
MKLCSLKISGFRGFTTQCEFDLSADATIVVGPNGLGKTSLFDAILWGLSGTLPRVGSDEQVLSLYSENGQARVSLCLRNNDRDFLVTRSTDGQEQFVSLKADGTEFKGASATARLLEALWPEATAAKDQGIALASILSRTNYLQQDRLRDFVESSDDQQRFTVFCELVGTGRLTELQSTLESESRSWAIATTKFAKEGAPLVQRVQELELQLEKLRRVAMSPDTSPPVPWTEWWKTKFGGEEASETVPDPLSPDSASVIASRLTKLQSLRDLVARRLATVSQVLELLKARPANLIGKLQVLEAAETDISAELAKIRSDIEKLKQERAAEREAQTLLSEARAQTVTLAKLAIRLLGDRCPICAQDYDKDSTLRRLEALVANAHSTEFKPEVDHLEDLLRKEREASERLGRAQALVNNARAESGRVDLWQKELDRRLLDLSVQNDEKVESSLLERRDALTNLEKSIRRHCVQGELLSLGMARVTSAARLTSTEEDLNRAWEELRVHEGKLKSRELTSEALKTLIASLRDANSKVALARIKEIEPFVQRIYSRIDPHPAFQLISFVTTLSRGKGHLNAQLQDRIRDVASLFPHAVLSSSQLNALALAVFLSFNLAIPKLPIDCALLDDPLQSLDDINLLGVVDLLRRVKDRRQLVISTHDVRFGRLLARKLRPSSEHSTTSVIEFSDWTRRGPIFSQSPVEVDSGDLRLVRAT